MMMKMMMYFSFIRGGSIMSSIRSGRSVKIRPAETGESVDDEIEFPRVNGGVFTLLTRLDHG